MAISAEIKNFQSLGQCAFDFEGFTVITGPSNFGKSAIIRALGAALYNVSHPSWVRVGEKQFEVRVQFGSYETAFTKGKKVNTYKVKKGDQEVESVAKAGIGVPQVYKTFGLAPIKTERGSEYNLNITYQLDPLFLVNETPVEMTSLMNAVFGTVQYERAQRRIAQEIINIVKESNKHKDTIIAKERDVDALQIEKASMAHSKAELGKALEECTQAKEKYESLVKYQVALEDIDKSVAGQEEEQEMALSVTRSLTEALDYVGVYFDLQQATSALESSIEADVVDRNWGVILDHLMSYSGNILSGLEDMMYAKKEKEGKRLEAKIVFDAERVMYLEEGREDLPAFVELWEAKKAIGRLEGLFTYGQEALQFFEDKVSECVEQSQEILCDTCPMRI